MESKRNRALRLFKLHNNILSCPVCGNSLKADDDYTLSCILGHSFDISKKGVVNFAGKGNDILYDDFLFTNRREVIKDGYFAPLIDKITKVINENISFSEDRTVNLLDAGCGEGSFLNSVYDLYKESQNNSPTSNDLFLGVDLSKKGINMASDHNADIIWLIDDLSKMNIKGSSFDIILNILSPANYEKFRSILKNDGFVVKVIPGKEYLKEIRSLYDKHASSEVSEEKNDSLYNNTETKEHTRKEMNVILRNKVNYTLKLNSTEFKRFVNMTPMTKNKYIFNDEYDSVDELKKVYELTIDLEIFVGKL